MKDLDHQRLFFSPICTEEEIDRIFDVQNASDYLLKLRAETIVDHMRLFRVYRHKAMRDVKSWSLEKSFDSSHYEAVLNRMPVEYTKICETITYGDVFSTDPNGMIFKTNYGPVTTISESLKYFLRFAHLAILNFPSDVPMKVRLNALRIAIRVMLQTEALDFYMDPRGVVPVDIAKIMLEPIPYQMQFIAGHEVSHKILGHLDSSNVIDQPIFMAISDQHSEYGMEKVYTVSQQLEFQADIHSIQLPNYNDSEKLRILEGALLWFGCMDLYQGACDVMFPASSLKYKTHPLPMERFDNLISNIPHPQGFQVEAWDPFPKRIAEFRKLLEDDIAFNIDVYEKYGSVYLDEPNTEWRGKELVDRVDY